MDEEIKVLFPEGVEKIIISKNDYDRLYGKMTLENIELEQEIEQLKNRITELEEINKQHQELNAKLRDELENSCWDEASVRADVLLEQQDYEERCEKAVEYIKNCEIIDKDKKYLLIEEQFGEDLLNILQDKEEV